ncbi:hypothetical protein DIE14_23175 [Burkholderia sp. Bp9017]|nr:hypothetical protein DIE14_23175 [Burkholderia sp. Bp9017]RQZ32001.1 hypothetical protein DIE13_23045 [Burkholderia sp. Bp9016]
MSSDQRKTALRVAAVPKAAFERQVESKKPPSRLDWPHTTTNARRRRNGSGKDCVKEILPFRPAGRNGDKTSARTSRVNASQS